MADQNKCPLCGRSTRSLLEWVSKIFIEIFKFFGYFVAVLVVFVVFFYFWSKSDSHKGYKQKSEVSYIYPKQALPSNTIENTMLYSPDSFKAEEFRSFSEKICIAENTRKDGFDSRFYAVCYKSMLRSIEIIVALNSKHHEGLYITNAYPFCAKWSLDTSAGMKEPRNTPNANYMKFCLEQEIDVLTEMQKYYHKYDGHKVAKIIDMNIEKNGSLRPALKYLRDAFGPIQ